MKKKIKDVTIGELIDFCSKVSYIECSTGICPFDKICWAIRDDLSNVSDRIISIYDQEIEIKEVKQ